MADRKLYWQASREWAQRSTMPGRQASPAREAAYCHLAALDLLREAGNKIRADLPPWPHVDDHADGLLARIREAVDD